MTQLGSPHPRVLLFNGAPGPCPYTKHQPKASQGCVWFPYFFTGAASPVLSCPTCHRLPAARTVLVLSRWTHVPEEG